MNTIKTIVAALAASAALGGIVTPLANAATPIADLLAACKVNDDPYINELAIDLTLDEGDVFNMINDYRAENGLDALTFDRSLGATAVVASHDSALRGFSPSDHVDSLGRTPDDRASACGVDTYGVAENSAWTEGQEVSQSGATAFDMWVNSPLHNDNMLNSDMTRVGLALSYIGEIGDVQEGNRTYWTVVFSA